MKSVLAHDAHLCAVLTRNRFIYVYLVFMCIYIENSIRFPNIATGVFEDVPDVPDTAIDICSKPEPESLGTSGWLVSDDFGLFTYGDNLTCSVKIRHQGSRYLLTQLWLKVRKVL